MNAFQKMLLHNAQSAFSYLGTGGLRADMDDENTEIFSKSQEILTYFSAAKKTFVRKIFAN